MTKSEEIASVVYEEEKYSKRTYMEKNVKRYYMYT